MQLISHLATFALLFTLALTGQAQTIEFNEAGGFTEGQDLSQHPRWIAMLGSTLEARGQGQVRLSTEAWKTAIFNESVALVPHEPVKISAIFQFDTAGPSTSNADLLSVCFYNGPSKKSLSIRGSLRRTKNGKFDLFISSLKKDRSETTSAASVGITAPNDTSDNLKLSMSLIKGDSEKGWTVTLTLENADTNTPLLTLYRENVAFPPSFFNSSTYYAGFSSARKESDSKTQKRYIKRFAIEKAQAAPEPIGLF